MQTYEPKGGRSPVVESKGKISPRKWWKSKKRIGLVFPSSIFFRGGSVFLCFLIKNGDSNLALKFQRALLWVVKNQGFRGFNLDQSKRKCMSFWLVVSTHLKNISQIGSFPQIKVNMKNVWNHQLGFLKWILYTGSLVSKCVHIDLCLASLLSSG